MLPWGTPKDIGWGSDKTPLVQTLWVCMVEYDLNHWTTERFIPSEVNLSNMMLLSKVSKALLRSKNIRPVSSVIVFINSHNKAFR